MTTSRFIIAAVGIAAVTATSSAAIVSYTDFGAWTAATGPVTSIFFDELPIGTVVTDQYASLGVTFDGHLTHFNTTMFPSDGFGLVVGPALFGTIGYDFAVPVHSISIEHTGHLQLQLFSNGESIGFSTESSGSFGTGFIGVIASTPIDRVQVINYAAGYPRIDNLHFGAPIPAPAGIAVLLALGLGGRRRGFAGQSA